MPVLLLCSLEEGQTQPSGLPQSEFSTEIQTPATRLAYPILPGLRPTLCTLIRPLPA